MIEPRIRVLEVFFLAVLVALSYGLYVVLRPFLLSIFLAVVFTSVLFPMHERLTRLMRGNLAVSSLLIVAMVFVVVAVPVTIIGLLVYSEAVSGYASVVRSLPRLTERLSGVSLLGWARELPLVGDYIAEVDDVDLSSAVRSVVNASTDFIISATRRSFVSVAGAFGGFVLMLFLMYFLFYGGRRLIRAVFDVVPIPNHELSEIAKETRRTASATLISTLLIGLIEGGYGALLFIVFGLPSPFLWGVVIMVLSMIPLVGTNLVLAPAGIILIVSGRTFAGVAMIALGLGGVAVTQNVVRPKLLGDRAGLHPALALLATIGGIAWLGLIGFLVGPLVAALCILVWKQFGTRYRTELDRRGEQVSDPPTG